MIVTAWNNGKHHSSGAGYGFKLSAQDRDAQFERGWESVLVSLPNGTIVEANTNKASFWSDKCKELINQQFGEWLIQNQFAPWRKGHPPKFELTHTSANRFTLDET